MVRHTDAENATYWTEQAEAWVDANVHGKPVDDFVAIAGQAVVELPASWSEDDAQAARHGMADAGFPVPRVEDRRGGGKRLRIDATDDRLPVPF